MYIAPAATSLPTAKGRFQAIIAAVLVLSTAAGCIDPAIEGPRLLVGVPIVAEPCNTGGGTCIVNSERTRFAVGETDGSVGVNVEVEAFLCVVPSPEDAAWAGDVGFLPEEGFEGPIAAQACDASGVIDGTCDPIEVDAPKLYLLELASNGATVCDALRASDFQDQQP